jgi:hypothetical protein
LENPGVYTLAQLDITAVLAASAQTSILNLDGMQAVSLMAAFAGGAGGTSLTAVVQTTMDGGATWQDVARFDFTTTGQRKIANLDGMTPKGVVSYAALGADSVLDGYLGNRLRAVVTTVGVYSNTTLLIQAAVR